MIRSQTMLLRHAQDFFHSDLVGLYRWDQVRIAAPELREAIPPNIDRRDRRRLMEEREGKGKYLEQERLHFGPWEILIYSAQERGPVGHISLRDFETAQELVTGPLDPSTWERIGEYIRTSHGQRRAG